MKTVCIVQARMGSKRLPGKVLLPLNGHTVIGEVLTRCKRIPGVDRVVATVPFTKDSLPLEVEASKYADYVYSGTEHDVLKRYLFAAKEERADIIVRVTGDCPLISPEICGAVLHWRNKTGACYASNVSDPRTVPSGLDCEVFTFAALLQADEHAGPYEREHVTTWMRRNLLDRICLSHFSIDTERDYEVACAAFGHEPYQRLRAA